MFKFYAVFFALFVPVVPLSGNAQVNAPETPQSALVNQEIQAGKKVYLQHCTFCHAPKSPDALPDLQAWIRLLYTSACPQVTVTLSGAERQSIKRYFELQLKHLQK